MKVLLDVKESKALFFMELLKSFSFVKARPITNEQAFLFQKIERKADAIEKSRQEAKEGQVYHYDNVEDFFKKMAI
jgi:hypothetical protein